MRRTTTRVRWTIGAAASAVAALTFGALGTVGAQAVPPAPPAPPAPQPPTTVAATAAPGATTASGGTARGSRALRERGRLGRPAPTDSVVVVRFRAGVSPAAAAGAPAYASALRAHRATRAAAAPALGAMTYDVPTAQTAAFVASMKARPDVAEVRTAVPTSLLFTPNDPQYATQQAAYLTKIAAPGGWDYTGGKSAVRIAVVDTGVDVGHPDLSTKIAGTYNAVDGSADVTDTTGHGTFVAGAAAAATNNKVGIAGVGGNTQILAVKVEDSAGRILDSYIVNGIDWAVAHGADVINLSLGREGVSVPSEAAAVKRAQDAGVLVVAAAGNSGQEGNPVFYPAAYPGVVSVGATDAKGHRAWFSEHGNWVTMAAPGIAIRGTTPRAGSDLFAASYSDGEGTSFASPLVAGAAALLWARSPGATYAQVRQALVAGAHGYAGLGLGKGQLDVARSLSLVVPSTKPTVTAPAAGATVRGATAFTAKNGIVKAKVGWYVDGTRVALVASGATYTWTPNGWANGSHTVEARDCTAAGVCAATGTTRTVTLSQARPTLTRPVAGAVSGAVTAAATAPAGGGVAILVDGTKVAFDGTAPFAPVFSMSPFSDGSHTVEAVVCNASGSRCAGPRSTAVTVTSTSLHPTTGTVTNPVLSPNGDGRKDTTVVRYTLDRASTVKYAVVDRTGATVRSVVVAATQAAGSHAFTWNGRRTDGTLAAGGTYQVRVSTADPSQPTLRGMTTASVRVDRTAPKLTGVTAGGATFYPVVDAYKDTFTPRVTVSEKATVSLTVRNAAGTAVRTISAGQRTGTVSIAWDGRSTSGALVPAGKYTWRFTVTDLGGNRKASAVAAVTVSRLEVVAATMTKSLTGSKAYDWGGTATCATVVSATSTYAPTGRWLKNNCATSASENALAWFSFSVPAAIRYKTIKITTTGRSHSAPATLGAGVFSTQTNEYDVTPLKSVSGTATQTVSLGTISGPGHAPGRKVDVVVYVPNVTAPPTDWDIQSVKVTVAYDHLG
ncbi:S8 family serine peptidase [Kineosporia sp. R_H_3]|uniref:S8 family serine peptidase n=1 Tax=Kineosporia sp. R_H_3 TaxID=1961848 RepID=UPI000B4A7965|nr:S8 family serine peptidase [Kineosporia sp. R_H_3]